MTAFNIVTSILHGVTLYFFASLAFHYDTMLSKFKLLGDFVSRAVDLARDKYGYKSSPTIDQLKLLEKIDLDQLDVANTENDNDNGNDTDNSSTTDSNNDTASAATTPTVELLASRELFFVRHGESTWNDMVNKGFSPTILLPKLIRGFAYEAFLLSSGNKDSKVVDAPLNRDGEEQAEALRAFLADEASHAANRDWQVLNGFNGHKSVIVCSNLRRALSTVVIAFQDRLRQQQKQQQQQQNGNSRIIDDDNDDDAEGCTSPREPTTVLVNPFLQETSFNADCLPIHRPSTADG